MFLSLYYLLLVCMHIKNGNRLIVDLYHFNPVK